MRVIHRYVEIAANFPSVIMYMCSSTKFYLPMELLSSDMALLPLTVGNDETWLIKPSSVGKKKLNLLHKLPTSCCSY